MSERLNSLHRTKWEKQKLKTTEIKDSYKRLGEHVKAERVQKCGSYLTFKECPQGHQRRIVNANFCRNRLCPTCAWRKSMKVFCEFREVAHKVMETQKGQWLFLTLTVRNVQEGSNLSSVITHMFQSWLRLCQRKVFRQSVLGWFRALEITVNQDDWSYHPHFHALLLVRPSYFSGKRYIKQDSWAKLWQESLQSEYKPVVDIRAIHKRPQKDNIDSLQQAILETAKYPVKPDSYVIQGNNLMTDTVVKTLDVALFKRRLIAYGGILKDNLSEIRQNKDIGTEEVSCSCEICGGDLLSQIYRWQSVLSQYTKL